MITIFKEGDKIIIQLKDMDIKSKYNETVTIRKIDVANNELNDRNIELHLINVTHHTNRKRIK